MPKIPQKLKTPPGLVEGFNGTNREAESHCDIVNPRYLDELAKLMVDPNPIIRSRALEHFRKTVGLEGSVGVQVNYQQTAIVQSAGPRSFEEATPCGLVKEGGNRGGEGPTELGLGGVNELGDLITAR